MYVYRSETTPMIKLTSTTTTQKRSLCFFVIFPLFPYATSFFPQATTNLLFVIIDLFEFSRILCTWNYAVCALFWSFIQHDYLKSIHAACINSSSYC